MRNQKSSARSARRRRARASLVATDLNWFLDQARPAKVRSMRQFAEDEVVIPDGPFQGSTRSRTTPGQANLSSRMINVPSLCADYLDKVYR
jgi:hypothetical protein